MLYGVFADVHANVEALRTVLDFFAASGAEGYLCCGDLVGYGPDPNACLERVRELPNLRLVCGNHDLAAIGRIDPHWFNPPARSAVLWTGRTLSPASREFLETLSARLDAEDFTLVHGTPRRPVDEYLLGPAQFKDALSEVRNWPLFFGHSHMPLSFSLTAGGRIESLFLDDRQAVSGTALSAYNPGAVGQPRDNDHRACCALWDSREKTFRVFRLDYDVAATQAKIRRSGLPEYLARRLSFGQ
jgi:diadenosine tetraphosphatase ApaH/serine/threonine PP2A family protein phosphatase